MDKEGYPEQGELDRIAGWSANDLAGLMRYVRRLWWNADWGFHENGGGKICLHTGGWSGNEDVIEALQKNRLFWLLCWQSSRRGGHYEFTLPGTSAKVASVRRRPVERRHHRSRCPGPRRSPGP